MNPRCVSSVSVLGSAPIAPAALRRPAVAIPNPPSPFFFVILSFLGDSKKERYLRLFYSYISSLIYSIIYKKTNPRARSCHYEPANNGNLFSLRGNRLPAYLQADFVARKGLEREGPESSGGRLR